MGLTQIHLPFSVFITFAAFHHHSYDVGNLTFISAEGENALLELMRHGARFHCGGVFTKHIV
jgi:hypothetical protein